jgi:hypothetical protein
MAVTELCDYPAALLRPLDWPPAREVNMADSNKKTKATKPSGSSPGGPKKKAGGKAGAKP